jgi:deoxyadenosine/deoxycytidine kinase
VRRLSERLGLVGVEEEYRDNPYLEHFYADQPRWAFQSQLWFVTTSAAADQALGDAGAVKELTPHFLHTAMTSTLHEVGVLGDDDCRVLGQLTDVLTASLRVPDAVVLLEASTDELVRRIGERGRDFEQRISPDYLERISRRYRASVADWERSPVVTVDTERDDPRTDAGLDAMAGQVRRALGEQAG